MSEHATPLRGIGEIGLIPDGLDDTPLRGIGEIGLIPDDLDDTPLRGIGEIGLIPTAVINPDCSDSPQGGRVTASGINPDCSDSPQGGRVTASGINPDCSDSPQGGGVAQMTNHERKTEPEMIQHIPKADDRAEWLAQRHDYFNASDAAALLDRHPFKSLQQVVRAKLEPAPVPEPENEAMRRGRHAEPFVASWLADRDGFELYEPAELYVNGAIMATLDRLPVVEDGTAVEIKTTAKRITDPEAYWLDQVQLQMHCAGLDAVLIAAVDATWKLQTWRIERDDALIAGMVDRAELIMAAVSAGRWPEGVPETDPATTRQPGKTVELDADALALVDDLATVRQQLRDLEAEEDVTRLALLRALGDGDVGEHDGRVIVRNAWTSRRHIDTARLRADHPDLAAQYEKATSYPTLRVVR